MQGFISVSESVLNTFECYYCLQVYVVNIFSFPLPVENMSDHHLVLEVQNLYELWSIYEG